MDLISSFEFLVSSCAIYGALNIAGIIFRFNRKS